MSAKDSAQRPKSAPPRQAPGQSGRPSAARPAAAAAPVLRHADEAVASILAREAYTRERHYFLMRLIVIMAVLLLTSFALNAYQATRPVQFRYFLSDSDGRIREMTALDRPINSLSDLSIWVTNSVAQALTFSFANYRQELSAARTNFTAAGWRGFEAALEKSGNLKSVIDNKFVARAVPKGAPVLVTQGLIENRYAWKFQLPILVTYEAVGVYNNQDLLLEIIVVRQPETEHPRGLGIASITFQ